MGATIGEIFLNRLNTTHVPVPLTPAQVRAQEDNQAIARGLCYRTAILPKRFKDRQLPTIYGYGRTATAAIADAGMRFIDRAVENQPMRTAFEYETATYCISPRLAAQYESERQSEPDWDYDDPHCEEMILNYEDDQRYARERRSAAYNLMYFDDQAFSQ